MMSAERDAGDFSALRITAHQAARMIKTMAAAVLQQMLPDEFRTSCYFALAAAFTDGFRCEHSAMWRMP